ncbi:cullin-1-like [Aristolochia californica]|uniref:cullin-1-like n=1 Tax=Aristolochia californica TaxID=171875 RepID=UPI0035DE65AC
MMKACLELSHGLEKLVRVTDDPYSMEEFTADEHIKLYTIVYDLCTAKGNCREMEEVMYDSFMETIEEYLSERVLPPLQRMQGDELAQQFVTKWFVYKDVYEKVSHIFYYLLRSFMTRKILDPAKVRTQLFYDGVFKEIHQQVVGAAISMVGSFFHVWSITTN